jgi:hypothetical protein
MKVFGKAGKFTDRLFIPVSGHGSKMTGSTNVNTGGVGIGEFKGFF